MHLQIRLHMHICIDPFIYTYTILDTYMCIYPCIYIHIYTYSYLYTYCIRSSLTDVPLTEGEVASWLSQSFASGDNPYYGSAAHSHGAGCTPVAVSKELCPILLGAWLHRCWTVPWFWDGCDVAVDSHHRLSHSDHHAKVHDRMPVFLTPESAPTQLPFMQGLLCPFLKG